MNDIIFDGALGDTITLSAVLPSIYERSKKPIVLRTNFPEIFDNNPYVSNSLNRGNLYQNIEPCRNVFIDNLYSCNCIKNYCSQLNIEYNTNIHSKIYFTDEEISFAKEEFSDFIGYKKLAVCLYSSSPARDLEYDYISNFLISIKDMGVKLIFFGTKTPNDYNNIFDRYVIGQPYVGLRRVFSLLSQCDLYLGVDTGLFHAAAAVGIPQVVFFRNNGCNVNAYNNTHYINSNIECSQVCRTVLNTYCNSKEKCTQNYDLKSYYQIINNLLKTN